MTPPELGRANTTSEDGPPALITIASLKSPSGDIPEHSPSRDVLFRAEVASGDVELPMAKNVNPLAVLATALVTLVVVSGCGAGPQAAKAPFARGGGVESGPGSRLWGDGSSGPTGMHTGCIRGRRLAVLITVHNRSKRTITLLGADGAQPFRDVIERVGAQVRLAPPPPKGDLVVVGLRPWSGRDSSPVAIPPERDGWVQSNFLMRNCALLGGHQP